MLSNGSQTAFTSATIPQPYARLKPQMRYKAQGDSLILHLRKHPVLYRDYLAPSTLAKLNSTLQRPDISDDFRNQITEILSKYEL